MTSRGSEVKSISQLCRATPSEIRCSDRDPQCGVRDEFFAAPAAAVPGRWP